MNSAGVGQRWIKENHPGGYYQYNSEKKNDDDLAGIVGVGIEKSSEILDPFSS